MDPHAYLLQFLNQTLRIEVHDDRFFIGRLRCVDAGNGNVILMGTHEYRPPADITEQRQRIRLGTHPLGYVPYESRFIGLVVIPSRQQRRLELEQRVEDTTAEAPFSLFPRGGHQLQSYQMG